MIEKQKKSYIIFISIHNINGLIMGRHKTQGQEIYVFIRRLSANVCEFKLVFPLSQNIVIPSLSITSLLLLFS